MTTALAKRPEQQLPVEQATRSVTYSPRVDIWEGENELLLCADLPGVRPEDVDLRYEDRQLSIRGRVEPRHPQLKCLYGEYGIGDFSRSFTIGEAIDAEKITAECKHGVLIVHLPKSEHLRPRRIEVKT